MSFINIYYSDAPAIYYKTLRNAMSILFTKNFEIIKSELFDIHSKHKSNFSLTFDYWKTDNQDEYMAITIHYIDKDWNLISRLIDMKLLTEIHNAAYLAEILNGVLKSFGISDKVQTYVFIFYFYFFFVFLKMINYSIFFRFFRFLF